MAIFVVPGIILLAALLAGYYFSRLVIYPKIFPYEETYRLDIEHGRLVEDLYKPWPKEEVLIDSPFGYQLFAIYHPHPGSQRTVVVSHGITWSLYGSVKYAALFYQRGYNVLLYDLRHHGRSQGPNTSFGFYEKEDLKAVVDYAFRRLGGQGIVGTVGESLGAETTLQHAGIDPRIAFVLADCSYSDLPDLLSFRLRKDYHLPAFPLLNLANFFTWISAGWKFNQASPIHCIPQIMTPIFFVHGQKDTYIPPRMSMEMYEAKKLGHRKIYLAPNAIHAESLITNPVEYDQQLGEFLSEIGL